MTATFKAAGQQLAAPFLWLHRRLLPRSEGVGWTPYLWLFYLVFLFIPWSGQRWSAVEWTVTSAGAVLFLVLYFFGFRDSRYGRKAMLFTVGSMAVLGYFFIAYNGNGQVFIIYAAAFCGFVGSMRLGFAALIVVLGFMMVEFPILGLLHSANYVTWAWLPGLFFGAIVGLMNIYFGEVHRKNQALKQSQEEIRRLAALAERERIARDLHDLLGHTLTVITVKAELAAKLAERNLPAAAREIREVESISRDALQQVRQAVGGYRGGGLLGELANARVALTAANVRLAEKVEPPKLSPAQDSVLAMVMREAVTNIVRHSGAQHCRIELDNGGPNLRLLIEDDGHGGTLHEGNGLKGMRERLQALSGSVQITSGHDGTSLAILLPLHPAAPQLDPAPT